MPGTRSAKVAIVFGMHWCKRRAEQSISIARTFIDNSVLMPAYPEAFQRVDAQAQAPAVAAKSSASTLGILFDATSL
jgi:hypothetical protein